MTESIRVECLTERYWDTATRTWQGTTAKGSLIDISVESAEDSSEKVNPVGIVMLDDGTFQSVPMEFINKEI